MWGGHWLQHKLKNILHDDRTAVCNVGNLMELSKFLESCNIKGLFLPSSYSEELRKTKTYWLSVLVSQNQSNPSNSFFSPAVITAFIDCGLQLEYHTPWCRFIHCNSVRCMPTTKGPAQDNARVKDAHRTEWTGKSTEHKHTLLNDTGRKQDWATAPVIHTLHSSGCCDCFAPH